MVTLASWLVWGFTLFNTPRTIRKSHRNTTATRSPTRRRSASKVASMARARMSCHRFDSWVLPGSFFIVVPPSPALTLNYFALARLKSTLFALNAADMGATLGPIRFNMTAEVGRTGVHTRREGGQRGQSLVEFAISSIVLLLLMMGLLDLSRAFYFAVNLQGAAREGARHGAWFNTSSRANLYLDDADVMAAVNSGLSGSGLVGTFVPSANCLVPSDG